MIRIQRCQCPPSLDKPDCQFRENDYGRAEVKDALMQMQNRKCCYCETKFFTTGPRISEIEHFIPRSASDFKAENGETLWHLANKWTNLLYACKNCNGIKLGRHPINSITGEYELIDPSSVDIDPEDHIDFIMDDNYNAYKKSGKSILGGKTCAMLKLDERRDLIWGFGTIALDIDKQFKELGEAIMGENDPEIEAKKRTLRQMMSAHLNFSAFRRAYIRMKLSKFNGRVIPHYKDKLGIDVRDIEIKFPSGSEIVG